MIVSKLVQRLQKTKRGGISETVISGVLPKCVTGVRESGNTGRTQMQTVEMAGGFQWFNAKRSLQAGTGRQTGRQAQVNV